MASVAIGARPRSSEPRIPPSCKLRQQPKRQRGLHWARVGYRQTQLTCSLGQTADLRARDQICTLSWAQHRGSRKASSQAGRPLLDLSSSFPVTLCQWQIFCSMHCLHFSPALCTEAQRSICLQGQPVLQRPYA